MWIFHPHRQQKRDILRQKEFQKKDLEVANEAFENHLKSEVKFKERIKNIVNDEDTSKIDKETQTDEKSDVAEYELKIEAHEMCKNFDIIEAIGVNFDGTLDDMKVDKEDTMRKILVQKMRERQNELPVYIVLVKNDDIAKEIIESRREVHKFDDYTLFIGRT